MIQNEVSELFGLSACLAVACANAAPNFLLLFSAYGEAGSPPEALREIENRKQCELTARSRPADGSW